MDVQSTHGASKKVCTLLSDCLQDTPSCSGPLLSDYQKDAGKFSIYQRLPNANSDILLACGPLSGIAFLLLLLAITSIW